MDAGFWSRLACAVCALTTVAAGELTLTDSVSMFQTAHIAAQDVVAQRWATTTPTVSNLVCSEPSRSGHVSKNAAIRLSPTLIPKREVVEQLRSERVPTYSGCQVYVSEAWKFIFVRNPKSSSTALLNAITAQICGGSCTEAQLTERRMLDVLEPIWESYFVFTAVRNPWTRALSAFTMFNTKFLFKDPSQPDVPPTEHCGLPFDAYAEDSYRLRGICETESCCTYIGGKRTPGFVDIHITDQSHCAFLPNGDAFVDYIGTSESLAQSWKEIVAAINERAGTDFVAADPDNPNGVGASASGGVQHTCSSASEQYDDNTAYNVARHYALDVVRFGYM